MKESPEKGRLETPNLSPVETKNVPFRTSRPGFTVIRPVRPDIDRFAHSADVQNLVGLCLWAGLVDVQTRPVVAVVTMCKNPDSPGNLKGKRSAGSEATENGTLEAGWVWRVGVTASTASAAGKGRAPARCPELVCGGGLRHTVQEVLL